MKLFDDHIYISRRNELKKKIGSGIILINGNNESPMNYKDNIYPFRQNSNFLYYFGINHPDLNALIDIDNDTEIIYGHEYTIDDIIWVGEVPSLSALAERVGIKLIKESHKLIDDLSIAKSQGRVVHYLPPYRIEHRILISEALGINFESQNQNASIELIKAVIDQRAIKSSIEIEEMEEAVNITRMMHLKAMQETRVGRYEYEIVGEILNECKSNNGSLSYGVIFSINGQVLHNHHHENLMTDGRLVLNDSGAENTMCYTGDITRTFPVNGVFTDKQREIYDIVLRMEKLGIEMVKPGITYKSVHKATNRLMLESFVSLGLLKGDVDEMMEKHIGGLFMPHGLGHMIGLDVHDMEDLGENHVGYAGEFEREKHLGLKSLRLARTLQPGFVLTVEPGIYFIPQLIEKWKSENKFTEHINYDELKNYYDFGGVRIEDDVLVTGEGYKVLGSYIPKEISEIEDIMSL